jgi:hypothetical protein
MYVESKSKVTSVAPAALNALRVHPRERLVELADVAEAEAAQPRPRRLRGRHREAAQLSLRVIGSRHRQVVEAASSQRDRLGRRDDELRLREPTRPSLEMHVRLQRRSQPDRAHRLPPQQRSAMGSNRALGLPNAYAHLGSGLLCPGYAAFDSSIFPWPGGPFGGRASLSSAGYKGI